MIPSRSLKYTRNLTLVKQKTSWVTWPDAPGLPQEVLCQPSPTGSGRLASLWWADLQAPDVRVHLL